MEMHEAKAWFILVASFILLVIICTLATLGIFTRPKRWNDRPVFLKVRNYEPVDDNGGKP